MPFKIEIPLSEGAPLPFFDLQTSLENVTYTLEFRWNVRANSWFMRVLDETGSTVIQGDHKLVANWPMGAYVSNRQPPGAFVVVDSAGAGADPDVASLGVRHKLLYYTSTELGL